MEEDILILQIHRVNLAEAKSFEEYQKYHVAYVDYLVERLEARRKEKAALKTFLDIS